jgi:hypothetical protein
MTRKMKWIFIAPAALLGMALFIFIGGEIVRLLWNWLMPALFGWPEVTFWQALGLLVLCRVLFGGVGGHGRSRSRFRHRMEERMAERMAQRWETMTPEERDKWRRRRERWNFEPPFSEKGRDQAPGTE